LSEGYESPPAALRLASRSSDNVNEAFGKGCSAWKKSHRPRSCSS